MKRWNLIFRVFTAEYLKLKPSERLLARTAKEELVRMPSVGDAAPYH